MLVDVLFHAAAAGYGWGGESKREQHVLEQFF